MGTQASGQEFGLAKYGSQNQRQLEGDMVIMTLLARKGLPYNFVDDDAFKDFIKYFNPRLIVKHSTTFAKYKMPLLYGNVMDVITAVVESEVIKCNQVAFTTDCWTSKAEDPYITLTLHYINEKFELQKFVLNFENFAGRHNGYNISQSLDAMIKEFPNLAKVEKRVMVHDAAANMKSAINQLPNATSLLCADHLLNTSLLHACNNNEEIKLAIKAATDLTSRIHRSTLANQLLQTKCVEMDVDFVKLIAPVVTRWNSNFMMIDSILKVNLKF